jgi:uncharacterized coiled-coil DUF342 family protein
MFRKDKIMSYSNGVHFLEASIGNLYRARREGIIQTSGEHYCKPAQDEEAASYQKKAVKVLQDNLIELENSKQEARAIFKLIETARLPLEHEDDFAKRIITWLETNLPEGGYLKR